MAGRTAYRGVTAEASSEFRPTRPLWTPLAASTCRAEELGSSLSRDLQYSYPRKRKINRSALFAFWYRIDHQSLLGRASVTYWGS
jgi:hypothetical protein